MGARTQSRTFTADERANRDAWVTSRVENDCAGCDSIYDGGLEVGFRPAEHCPVHGIDAQTWWDELNEQLDERWPGTWH
jgi:hypothetical protein